ncbi:MAG: class I SAM-dependent methyltransferase [Gammaproteobacteria bacterium]|jgi:ubiquinone/menaquinone biosynthesis C-methylase UbiE
MSANENQPDWDKIAEKFDIWLPQIAPVGDALLAALETQPGDKIIDMGSGTGEPALTLARRMKDEIDITGIDAAEGMVKVAQKKVTDENLSGIRFTTMPAENMSFADNSFDRALCRFGVMLFKDPLQGLKEMGRVLKPDGRFALAVWSTSDTMRTMQWSYEVFKHRLDEEYHPPLAKVTSLGKPGLMEDLLHQAGLNRFTIEAKTFHYQFESFDDYWNAVEASDILKMQYDALPDDQRHQIRDEVGEFARDFVKDGNLVIPHDYLLVSGNK